MFIIITSCFSLLQQIYALIDQNITYIKVQDFYEMLCTEYPFSNALVTEYIEKCTVPPDVNIHTEAVYWRGILLVASQRHINCTSVLSLLDRVSKCYVARIAHQDKYSGEAVDFVLHLFKLAETTLFSEDCSFRSMADEVQQFLQNYIRRNNLMRGLLKKMKSLLVCFMVALGMHSCETTPSQEMKYLDTSVYPQL